MKLVIFDVALGQHYAMLVLQSEPIWEAASVTCPCPSPTSSYIQQSQQVAWSSEVDHVVDSKVYRSTLGLRSTSWSLQPLVSKTNLDYLCSS